MTARYVIDEVGRLRVHRAGDESLLRHLSRLENMLKTEVFGMTARALDYGDELLVTEPYDQIYELYLTAMVDLLDMEIERYNMGMAAFQAMYDEYCKWHRRTHTPKPGEKVHGYA